MGFFSEEALPQPLHQGSRLRIQDAFAGCVGVTRVFNRERINVIGEGMQEALWILSS